MRAKRRPRKMGRPRRLLVITISKIAQGNLTVKIITRVTVVIDIVQITVASMTLT